MKQFDLGWGNPYCVKQALDIHYTGLILGKGAINQFDYCLDDGYPELINLTKSFLTRTTGNIYKHIIITNGATGAINVALRVLMRDPWNAKGLWFPRYSFPFYPFIAVKNGIPASVTDDIVSDHKNIVKLLDSPSNPFGKLRVDNKDLSIWDSVYHNPVFVRASLDLDKQPAHLINCGSYSKYLGIAGARIGFIATNDETLYKECAQENLYESCTISMPSQVLISDILKNVRLDSFEAFGRHKIDQNRSEFSRLYHLFGAQDIQENGMFYCFKADDKLRKLLDESGVIYKNLDPNEKESWIRLSLGQTNEVTKEAVDAIIKKDRR